MGDFISTFFLYERRESNLIMKKIEVEFVDTSIKNKRF
jgi:hypothetical protein